MTKEELLGVKYQLGKGFVQLVDVMGTDSDIANAARVSYGQGTKSVSDDEHLIQYLLRHGHTSPFEMAELKFIIKCPMDTWRQWIRHRTASVNEYSTRYSEALDEMQTTNPACWRIQSNSNRQGSNGVLSLDMGKELSKEEEKLQDYCKRVYRDRLSKGVAREQARKDLPLATYTQAYWKIDLHNLLHFLKLRMDPAAQKEIREFANIIGNGFVAKLFPYTWEAFNEYELQAIKLSKTEVDCLNSVIKSMGLTTIQVPSPSQWNTEHNREKSEFIQKLRTLGFTEVQDAKLGAE